jgi:hypothetical protein
MFIYIYTGISIDIGKVALTGKRRFQYVKNLDQKMDSDNEIDDALKEKNTIGNNTVTDDHSKIKYQKHNILNNILTVRKSVKVRSLEQQKKTLSNHIIDSSRRVLLGSVGRSINDSLTTVIDEDDSLQWAFNHVNSHTDQELALDLFSIESKISYFLEQQSRYTIFLGYTYMGLSMCAYSYIHKCIYIYVYVCVYLYVYICIKI